MDINPVWSKVEVLLDWMRFYLLVRVKPERKVSWNVLMVGRLLGKPDLGGPFTVGYSPAYANAEKNVGRRLTMKSADGVHNH